MSGVYPIIKSSGFLSIFPSADFFLRGSWISFPVLAGHFETHFLTKRKRAFIMAFVHNFFVLKRATFARYEGMHLGNGSTKELKGIESRIKTRWKKRNWSLRKTERPGKERIKLFGKTFSKHRISCCFLCSVSASLFLNLLNRKIKNYQWKSPDRLIRAFVQQLPIFAFTLSSAFNGLTSVFEMRTGVSH